MPILNHVIILLVRASSQAISTFTPGSVSDGLNALVRQDFEAYRDSWFLYLLAWTAVVIFGIIFEGPEVVHDVVGMLHKKKSSTGHEATIPSWIKVLATIGWLFIVLGLVGEGISEAFVSKADGLIQTFNDNELAATETQVGNVNLIVALANERAGQFEDDAAKLKTENLQLETEIAPRRLTDGQEKQLSQLSAFAGNVIEIKSYTNDTESAVLGYQIALDLLRSGIQVTNNLLTMESTQSIDFGISVTGPNKELVERLSRILSTPDLLGHETLSMGGRPNVVVLSGVVQGPPAAATIVVGEKPLGKNKIAKK
ncbi:MAG TPA: hypothetical protein VKS20_11250 [Candidatus Acidoferrales bacterium]|nr:hypothetical protein [Candidatus Acidoferrales bacterium]